MTDEEKREKIIEVVATATPAQVRIIYKALQPLVAVEKDLD